MKEINIANIISTKRRDKGITQDELASYMGISKASVLKWETGQSYPDILLLPHLASFFNICIDELMGYSPQMKLEDIRKLYKRLANDFSHKPFVQVYEECISISKKYAACFEVLYSIASLLLNYYYLAIDSTLQNKVYETIFALSKKIQESSDLATK